MEVRNTTLDDLAAIIGFSATIRLAAWFGGANLYVPASVAEGQKIVSLIGEPATRRLSEEFGRQHIWVPSLNGFMREQRNAKVYYMLVAGVGTKEIATEICITERRVSQIRAEYERLNLLPKIPSKMAGENEGKNASKNEGENGR